MGLFKIVVMNMPSNAGNRSKTHTAFVLEETESAATKVVFERFGSAFVVLSVHKIASSDGDDETVLLFGSSIYDSVARKPRTSVRG